VAVAVADRGRVETVRGTPLRAVDILLAGYLAVVSVVALIRAPGLPGCWWLLAAHALFGVLLYLLTRPGLGTVGRTIREIYPLLLLVPLYSELDVLNGPAGTDVHDVTVQAWELAIFGVQLSTEWWRAMPSRFWSAVLHAAYLSYYLIVVAPAFYFVWRRQLPALRHFILVVMTTFVVCYLAFIFFPVAGPYYVLPRPDAWFTDNLFARAVYDTLATGSSYGTAFPSSHVAAAVAATLSAGRGSKALGWTLAVPTVLLTLAVVYCQMHYGVDAVAGLLVGAGVTAAVERLDPGWAGRG
jgi:membrane-associated phospholipid phosphatase